VTHMPINAGERFPQLSKPNISFDASAGGLSVVAMVVGAALVGGAMVLAAGNFGGANFEQALAAYHVGTMAVLAMCLGAMFFVMVFHLTNAGWTGTIRRQFENVMSFLPFAFGLVVVTLLIELYRDGIMFTWMQDQQASDVLLQNKSSYFFLNQKTGGFPLFWVLRAVIYGLAWTLLSRRLLALSLEQDSNPDPALTAKARKMCSWGMAVFALTTAFAAFDWLMSLDYKFFSTMWGVYYFAGSAFSASALVAFILARLRAKGKLEGAVTSEHFHDLGKLMFSFTVFWAYIAFSQYFLIWYSNIPEETAFFLHRSQGAWGKLGVLLMVGHFGAPFLILLFRAVKKSPKILSIMALWAIIIHVLDIYWIIRPMTYSEDPTMVAPSSAALLIDIAAIVGVIAIFAGFMVRRITSGLLVAVNDPRIDEALGHKNYV
jgi:hypothetical protein